MLIWTEAQLRIRAIGIALRGIGGVVALVSFRPPPLYCTAPAVSSA